MQGIVIEATNGVEWGSFVVCSTQDADFACATLPLFQRAGWSTRSVWALDLRSGIGFMVWSDGLPTDVYPSVKDSPLFRAFLSWLLTENLSSLDALPRYVDLSPDVRTIQVDDLVVEAVVRETGYEIIQVRDDQGRQVDGDLDRIEAALDNATLQTQDSMKQKKPMERATGRKEVHKRRGVGGQ